MKFHLPYYIKYCFFFIFCISVIAVTIFAISFFVIKYASRAYIYSNSDDLPHTQVAVILGAAILKSGQISPVLKDRVDKAIEIYNKQLVDKILVTGDNSSLDHNEVEPVRKYLLKNGIPDADVFLDHAGFDTYSSMFRARDVFKIESMVVVSQSFHLPRAVYIARRLRVVAYGIEADRGHYLFRNEVREVFGDVKALSNLLFDRRPKYLGPQIPITGSGIDQR